MSTATRTPVDPTVTWIRPWFPAGLVGHIFADCPDLLEHRCEPLVRVISPHDPKRKR